MISKDTKQIFFNKLSLFSQKTVFMRVFGIILTINLVICLLSLINILEPFHSQELTTDAFVLYITEIIFRIVYVYILRGSYYKLEKKAYILTLLFPIIFIILPTLLQCYNVENIVALFVQIILFIPYYVYFRKRKELFGYEKQLKKIILCKTCGEPLIKNGKFCKKCGAEITKIKYKNGFVFEDDNSEDYYI